jgi:hypothetical protein
MEFSVVLLKYSPSREMIKIRRRPGKLNFIVWCRSGGVEIELNMLMSRSSKRNKISQNFDKCD